MQSTPTTDFADSARTATVFLRSTLLNQGSEALLRAESEFLTGAEATITEWLHRRREAILDTQRLLARVRESHDVSDVLKAQQDWMAETFRRLADDAQSYSKATLVFANVARHQFGAIEQALEPGVQSIAEHADTPRKAPKAPAAE